MVLAAVACAAALAVVARGHGTELLAAAAITTAVTAAGTGGLVVLLHRLVVVPAPAPRTA
jgi:hypothetical protein